MAFIREEDSYKIWQNLPSSTWESLYNVVYEDYYGRGNLGFENKNVESYIMQFTRELIDTDGESFPSSWKQFHSFLNQKLADY